MSARNRELAIFDLDYTLTRQGTWGRFIGRAMQGRALQIPSLWAAAGLMQLRYKRGEVPRIAVKTAMMQRSITGRSRATMAALADAFVADDLADGMNARVVDALHDHQSRGHVVLIASAAIDLLVERYSTALGADGQVSTALPWTPDNSVGAEFKTENCYGAQKLARIEAWIAERNLSPSRITSYSDSRSDAPMLDFADRAVIVRPNRKTRAYARREGYEIW